MRMDRHLQSATIDSPKHTSSSVAGTGVMTAPFDAVDELFTVLGSGVEDVTVAVFDVPCKLGGAVNVALMVTDWPLLSVPRLQGNAVVQPPEFETKANPAGVGSLTTTFAAGDGPLLVTVIV